MQAVTVGAAQDVTVASASAVTMGAAAVLNVGGGYAIDVGGAVNLGGDVEHTVRLADGARDGDAESSSNRAWRALRCAALGSQGGGYMRSRVLWAFIVAVAIGVAVGVSACSRPPSNPSVELNWDEGAWDTYTWK